MSDRFVSGFWYLSQLGYLATHGYTGMHREQFWDGLLGEQGIPHYMYHLFPQCQRTAFWLYWCLGEQGIPHPFRYKQYIPHSFPQCQRTAFWPI